jgi:hypothetical protein
MIEEKPGKCDGPDSCGKLKIIRETQYPEWLREIQLELLCGRCAAKAEAAG